MSGQKKILMVAVDKKVEALRMSSGLTLLDDAVAIAVWGDPVTGPEADEQREALDFADVPVEDVGQDVAALAARILNSDVVYCV
ncbi:MAG: hypothetical protein ACOZB0_07020 [Pseudomonadota bacterium]